MTSFAYVENLRKLSTKSKLKSFLFNIFKKNTPDFFDCKWMSLSGMSCPDNIFRLNVIDVRTSVFDHTIIAGLNVLIGQHRNN